MVVSRKSPQGKHIDRLPASEKIKVLSDLVEHRGISTDDEIFEITGTYAHIEKITHHLDNIYSTMPQALQDLWQKERAARLAEVAIDQEQDATTQRKFLENIGGEYAQLQALTKQSIARSGSDRYLKLWGLSCGLGGCVAGLGLASLIGFWLILPRQLSVARGSDGPMLEWLATTDGRLLRRSFTSGNRSVEECVRKAVSQKKSTSPAKKVICMLEIE
jgi:hypothetical protein